MKVEVKKIDATKRELKFEVPKDRVKKKLDEVYEGIGREAKIKGFRPGKAPRHIIEQHYGKLAQEEMIKQIIPEVYQEALEQEQISPIDMPEIEDVSLKDNMVSFTATLDIRPEVQIKKYKGLKITRKSNAVGDDELKKTLEFIQKGQGQQKEVTIDDSFAKGLGYPSLEEFKTSLKRQLEIDKERHNRHEMENQIIDELIKNAQLQVPKSAVKKQLENRIHDFEHRLSHQGMKKEDVEKRIEEMRPELEKTSERDIHVFFIMEKIAELENIKVDKGDNIFNKVLEFLFKEAQWEEEKNGS